MAENEVRFNEEQQKIVNDAPVEDGPTKITFYCAVEGKGSNQQIPIGGHREKDSTGRVTAAPFQLIKFSEGIYRTEDELEIKVLRKLAKDSGSGITEDREVYLDKVLPPERNIKRLQQQIDEERTTNNRLREQILRGEKPDGKSRVKEGAITSGSVPRKRAD